MEKVVLSGFGVIRIRRGRWQRLNEALLKATEIFLHLEFKRKLNYGTTLLQK